MYFPYLRGKTFELKMLREVSSLLSNNGNIVPIIEPVSENTSYLERAIEKLIDQEASFTLITNPHKGELVDFPPEFLEEFTMENISTEYNNATMAYIISDNTTLQSLDEFQSKYEDRNLALIHAQPYTPVQDINQIPDIENQFFIDGRTSNDYRSHFTNYRRVLIKDGFNQRKNADYPVEEFFSDLHKTYDDLGFDGFGDFLIVGDRFIRGGGPAYAIAIHLTYLLENDDMHIKHFISDRTTGPRDPGGKFLEALTKLVAYLQDNPKLLEYSSACEEYLDLYERKHYPGLGFVKKLSMRHHIELMNTII